MKAQVASNTHERDVADEPLVPFYSGIAAELDQIAVCVTTMNQAVRDMRMAFDERRAVSVKLAAEEIAKSASQASIMAAHLSSVTAKHLNSRGRP